MCRTVFTVTASENWQSSTGYNLTDTIKLQKPCTDSYSWNLKMSAIWLVITTVADCLLLTPGTCNLFTDQSPTPDCQNDHCTSPIRCIATFSYHNGLIPSHFAPYTAKHYGYPQLRISVLTKSTQHDNTKCHQNLFFTNATKKCAFLLYVRCRYAKKAHI